MDQEKERESVFSTGSRQDTMTEMQYELDQLKQLVQADEWYNIPVPVKKCTDGLIYFSEKVTTKLIDNADSAHRKILLGDERLRKLEASIKSRLDQVDVKVERELKRIYDKILKQIEENKYQLVHANENSSRCNVLIETLQQQGYELEQVNVKQNENLKHLNETVKGLEKEKTENDKTVADTLANVTTLMNVPGLLGPDKNTCHYVDFPTFVKEMHEHKEESAGHMIAIMKSKLQSQEKASEKKREELKADLMEFMRIQEREIANLRIKFHQLDSDMGGLLGEDSGKSRGSSLNRGVASNSPHTSSHSQSHSHSHSHSHSQSHSHSHSHSQSHSHSRSRSRSRSRSQSQDSVKRSMKSKMGEEKSGYGVGDLSAAVDSGKDSQSLSDASADPNMNRPSTTNKRTTVAKTNTSQILPIIENTDAEHSEGGGTSKTKINQDGTIVSSRGDDMQIASPINYMQQINTSTQPISEFNDRASFQDRIRGSDAGNQQMLPKTITSRVATHAEKKRNKARDEKTSSISINRLGEVEADINSVRSRQKPTSITRRITRIFKEFSVGDNKSKRHRKGGKEQRSKKDRKESQSKSKSRPRDRSKTQKIKSTDNDQRRLDILIMHQIRQEKKFENKVMALRKMVTDLSRAMFNQLNRNQSSSTVTGMGPTKSVGRGSRQSPVTQRSPATRTRISPPPKKTSQVPIPASQAIVVSENSQSSRREETPSGSIASSAANDGPGSVTDRNQMVPANSLDSEALEKQKQSPRKPQSSKAPKDKIKLRAKKDSTGTFAKKDASGTSREREQKKTSFDISNVAKKKTHKQQLVTPAEVSEESSQAHISQVSLRPDSGEDISKIYSNQVAKKYHFVEVYLDHQKQNQSALDLYEKPKRKNSLEKLLTGNLDESYLANFNQSGLSSIGGGGLTMDRQGSIEQSINQKEAVDSKEGRTDANQSRKSGGRQFPPSSRMRDQNQHDMNTTFNSLSSRRSGGPNNFSPRSGQSGVCPKCHDEGVKRPCLDQIQDLRDEFMNYVDSLFRKKMQEFIAFIEEYVEVPDQTDPDQDNIIHAFYKDHNTLQKTSENFRLLEYKRKKYLEKRARSKSKSPQRETGLTTPQKTFLRSVYGGASESRQLEKNDQAPQQAGVFNRTGGAFRKLSVQPSTSQGAIDLMYKSTQSEYPADAKKTNNSRLGRGRNSQKPLTLTQQLPPTIEITSSAATQRKPSVFFEKNRQQLPIISTRKAHLTVDQRVWDADQNGSMITMPMQNSGNLEGQKNKHALMTNNSDGFMTMQGHHNTGLIPKQFDFQTLMPNNVQGMRNTIINQNSSLLNLTPVMSSNNVMGGIVMNKVNRTSMPLSVQFQEFPAAGKQ